MKVKSILSILFFVLQITFCVAQRPSDGRSGGNLGNGQHARKQKMTEFKSIQFVRSVKYFADDVINVTKVKEDNVINEITQFINAYNLNLDELLLLNKDVMDLAEITINEQIKTLQLNKNNQELRKSIRESMESLRPVKKQVEEMSNELDIKFEAILSKKGFKKWLKYKKKELQKIMPEQQESRSNSLPPQRIQRPSRGGGRGQGMNGF